MASWPPDRVKSVPPEGTGEVAESPRNMAWIYGVTAYGIWGLVPLYFKAVDTVSPAEVLAHRILWSFVLLAFVLLIQRRGREVVAALRQPRARRALLASTVLIALNWFVFIWAVTNHRVLEASLGYFINPLLTVVLGTLVLGERLRPLAAVAAGVALIGIGIQLAAFGHLPIVALVLAMSFGLYGLIRKTAPVSAMPGLLIETGFLVIPALIWLGRLRLKGELCFGTGESRMDFLLVAAGVITVIPLILFTRGARLLPLSTMGFLHYITPSGQFLLAVFAFHEALDQARLLSFCTIWLALVLFSWDQTKRGAGHERSRIV